jgi:hypothetical protein
MVWILPLFILFFALAVQPVVSMKDGFVNYIVYAPPWMTNMGPYWWRGHGPWMHRRWRHPYYQYRYPVMV